MSGVGAVGPSTISYWPPGDWDMIDREDALVEGFNGIGGSDE